MDYQDFDNEAQEFAFMVSDNKIPELAEHDDAMMFEELKALELDDFDLLGIPDLELPIDKEIEIKEKELDENLLIENECPSCGYKW